jgi:hypothetical protein
MIRPSVLREVTIDLPEMLVESLGVGAEVLAHYLTGLAEQGASNPSDHPPPNMRASDHPLVVRKALGTVSAGTSC